MRHTVRAAGPLGFVLVLGCGWQPGEAGTAPEMPRARATLPAPEKVAPPSAEAPPAEARGRGPTLYRQHCADCHGPAGRGDGPLAGQSRPRDLTTGPWRFGTDPVVIRELLLNGAKGVPKPAAVRQLAPADLDALTRHVLTFPPAERPATAAAANLAGAVRAAGWADGSGEAAPFLGMRNEKRDTRFLEDYRGKVVVLNFWGTQCAPSRQHLGGLERLADRFRGEPVVVLAVCVDQPRVDAAARTQRRYAPGLAVWVPTDSRDVGRFDGDGLPTTYLIDRRGRVRGSVVGAFDCARPVVARAIELCQAEP